MPLLGVFPVILVFETKEVGADRRCLVMRVQTTIQPREEKRRS